MAGEVNKVVILGGGTAGWLSAGVLAARHPDLEITLIESPDIPTIGVGEGTWPTMRGTLAMIGIPESEFLAECDASFKQGSRFDGWVSAEPGDSYYHPFSLPPQGKMEELLAAWKANASELSFAAAMTPQAQICARNLAPRQRQMPDFAAAANYAYHLDAAKFAALLTRHATGRLGVVRKSDHVTSVERSEAGDIAALITRGGDRIEGDLFLDCGGQAAMLIGQELGVGWIDHSDVSFNDRALAVQVPTDPASPVASQTVGTAHEAGWIWDIGLQSRRGIGCVYSSRFMENARAEEVLRDYIATQMPQVDYSTLSPRRIHFETGHREKFWHRNCLAIGLSAGFIEPLEASAIVLIELSLRALADNFPTTRSSMDIHSRRFNELFHYRWNRIVDFLKLHYVLSRREEPYWVAQRNPETIPDQLSEQLALWRDQPPSAWDFPQVDEIFSAASQQYVLYGMGFPLPAASVGVASEPALARLQEVRDQTRALCAALPKGRTYFENLAAPGVNQAEKEKTG